MVDEEKFENGEGESDGAETSAYNEAGLQIQRLHNFWIMAESYTSRTGFRLWHSALNSIERELWSDILKLPVSKEAIAKLDGLKQEYYKGLSTLKRDSMGRLSKDSDISACVRALDKRHKHLKWIQEKSGKGAIYRDTDTEGFAE